jgi:hypothetical protein
MTDRDFDANPYDLQERRVCDYLQNITGGTIGCGDDPVGWLLASYACVIQERNDLRAEIERLRQICRDNGVSEWAVTGTIW